MEVYWLSAVPAACQLSGRKITTQFVDARIGLSWALVHPAYFKALGGKLGVGYGQLYTRQADGRWKRK